MHPDGDELLFSYGTLRLPDVQRATFGRVVPGRDDAIAGYRIETITVTDPYVVATSGSDRHPVLRASSDPDAAVEGTAFRITADELAAADDYEVDAYRRVMVALRSGALAWVYVLAEPA